MKASRISWGIILVFIGTVFLLENYGVIDFRWTYVWKFWPIVLIVSGINIIFSRSESTAGKWLIIATTIFALGLITYTNLGTHKKVDRNWLSYNDEDTEIEDTKGAKSFYEEAYDGKFKNATLNINGGASSFIITNGDDNLFESSAQKDNNHYYLRKTDTDSVVVLDFKSKNKDNSFDFDDTDFNDVKIKVHPLPLWIINLNMGAGKANFDLSNNRVKEINIKGGAADFKVKIGSLYNDVNLSAETGIAKVSIYIPEDAGCKIRTKTGLSAKDFPGFSKSDDGTFISPDYNSTTNKIMINLKGGLSDFEVKRY